LPAAFAELEKVRKTLEAHFKDVQDFEFTIQDGKLFMLQTRNGKRTGLAAVRFAIEMEKEKLISWKTAIRRVPADQLDQVTFPTLDLTEPVTRYFEYLQRAVDFNRDLATRWAELVTTLSGSFREQAERVTGIVNAQTDTIADLTVKQAEKAEQVAKEQADRVEQAKENQAQQARAADRRQAKKDHERARERYAGLTKAELAEQLAERGLPRTGTVEELIERLVSADSE